MATAHAEHVNASPNVADIAPSKPETEDADIFGFLSDEAVEGAAALSASSTPTTPHSASQEALQQPPKAKRQTETPTADMRDPEVQYRKLQEQLGLVGHSESSPGIAHPPPVAQRQHTETLGASIGFKSVLDARKDKVASATRVVPKGRIRPKTKRGRLDRPFSGP